MQHPLHLQRSTPTTTPVEALISTTAELVLALDEVQHSSDAGRPEDPEDGPRIQAIFGRWKGHLQRVLGEDSGLAERLRPLLARWLRDQLHPAMLRSGIGYRAIRKPAGYAGDYATILQAYERRPRGTDRVGRLMDAAILELDVAWAVFHRRRLFADEIRRTHAAAGGRPARITSLACGPAEELVEASRLLDAARPLEATLLDIDRDALAHAAFTLMGPGGHLKVQTIRCNLIKVARGQTPLALPPQDLIYSAGLIDYLEDDVVVSLMDVAHGWLAPGGKVILGNVHPCNPERALMDHIFQWPLIHRTEADMDRLFRRSRFGKSCDRISFEPQGLNLFAECVR